MKNPLPKVKEFIVANRFALCASATTAIAAVAVVQTVKLNDAREFITEKELFEEFTAWINELPE